MFDTSTRKRRAGRRLVLTLALVLLAATIVVVQADAGVQQGVRVEGTYSATDFGATVCIPLTSTLTRCTTTGFKSEYDGDLEGSSVSNFTQIISCPTGRTYGYGEETFTGSLGDASGSLSWRLAFSADWDCTWFSPLNLRIVGVVTGGSGGLAGLHGVLSFDDKSYKGVLP